MPGDRFIELALTEDRHVLDVLFRHAREAVTVQDRAGNLVYANEAAARMVGMGSTAEILEVPVSDLVSLFEIIDESGQPIDPEDLPGRRVLAGLDAPELTVGYRFPGSSRVRWSRVNASPIKNDAGEVVWAINFFLDISEQVRERDTERLLATVNEALALSLTIEEVLGALVGLLDTEFGGWSQVHLTDFRGDLVLMAGPPSPEVSPGSSHDEAVIPVGSEALQARVVKTGQAELVSELEDLGHRGEGRREQRTGDGVHSVACVPVGGRVPTGTLTIGRSGGAGRAFDSTDLARLRRIGEKAAVALANARLFELEHETAEALRAGLAPSSLPAIEGLELAARYLPLARLGHIGGDFYDVIPTSGSGWAAVVGDIEGKGVPAAAAVGVARDTLRATIKLQPDPAVVLTQLNDALRSHDSPRMCTLAYLRIDRSGDGFDVRISLAGHPPPAVMRAGGGIAFHGRPCPPAGVLPAIAPDEVATHLSPGDILLAYTDGFALAGETPMETVARFLPGPGGPSQGLLDRMIEELLGRVESVRDDIALLALRVV